jgi:hypothetical protein
MYKEWKCSTTYIKFPWDYSTHFLESALDVSHRGTQSLVGEVNQQALMIHIQVTYLYNDLCPFMYCFNKAHKVNVYSVVARISNDMILYYVCAMQFHCDANCPVYNVWPLLDAKCNLLGYRRRRSICYTCLFTTSLVVTTISVYSVLWPSDVLSRSGPWISSVSVLNADSWLTWLFIIHLSSLFFLLSLSVSVAP